jgi:hypothetical protein
MDGSLGALHMGLWRVESQSGVRVADSDCWIEAKDSSQVGQHLATKVSRPPVF